MPCGFPVSDFRFSAAMRDEFIFFVAGLPGLSAEIVFMGMGCGFGVLKKSTIAVKNTEFEQAVNKFVTESLFLRKKCRRCKTAAKILHAGENPQG